MRIGVAALGNELLARPRQMKNILPEMQKYASVPIVVQPNAGIPHLEGGKTVFNVTPVEFAGYMKEMAKTGARGLGGCCGTTPEYIREMVGALEGITPQPITDKNLTMISSATHALVIGERPLLVGEKSTRPAKNG